MATLPMIGVVLAALGLVWLLVVVFKEGGPVWGVVCLFLPPVALLYAAMNWGESVRNPVLVWAGGMAIFAAATALGLD